MSEISLEYWLLNKVYNHSAELGTEWWMISWVMSCPSSCAETFVTCLHASKSTSSSNNWFEIIQ